MANLSRSPLLLSLMIITGIAVTIGAIATGMMVFRPQTVDPRGRASGTQVQVSNLPSPWRVEGSGIFRYDNGVFMIGLPLGSDLSQPMFWRNSNGDFTLELRLASIKPAGTNFPSPMIVFGDPNLPDQGVSIRLLYLSVPSFEGESRLSVGQIALYSGQAAVGEPLNTATLSTAEEVLIHPVPIVWLRLGVSGDKATVEYSLTGESWFSLGEVDTTVESGRLSIGMYKIQATSDAAPAMTIDHLIFREH